MNSAISLLDTMQTKGTGMIVVDQQADNSLIQALKTFSARVEDMRCIHFKLSTLDDKAKRAREFILSETQNYITIPTMQAYFCDDGDVFIVARNMSSRTARIFMAEAALRTGVSLTPDFAELIEINPNINKLLQAIQNKIDQREAAMKAAKNQEEQRQLQMKRKSILTLPEHIDTTQNVAQKRDAREKPELMIIEDDMFSRRLVHNTLNLRYSLTELGNAEAALETYIRIAPDLLFLDINLPNVTGHELLEKIIAIDPKAYVIMLSGNSDRENMMKAMRIGAKGFVAKPFTREKLFQYIERCPTIQAKEI